MIKFELIALRIRLAFRVNGNGAAMATPRTAGRFHRHDGRKTRNTYGTLKDRSIGIGIYRLREMNIIQEWSILNYTSIALKTRLHNMMPT